MICDFEMFKQNSSNKIMKSPAGQLSISDGKLVEKWEP